MKKLIISVLLFTSYQMSNAQEICTGHFIKLLSKHELYLVPCEDMFVLNTETFARYYYQSVKYDSLLDILPRKDSLMQMHANLSFKQMEVLSQQINLQQNQLAGHNETIRKLENILKLSINNNEDCINQLALAEQKQNKLKKQNKFFKRASVILGSAVLVMGAVLIVN